MGDFNAHHKTWNCQTNKTNGKRFLDSLDIYNAYLHNPNSLTRGNANLDLVFSTLNIAQNINVKVHDEPWGSDHLPIYIYLNVTKNKYKRKTHKLTIKKTNWKGLVESLEESYVDFLDPSFEALDASGKYNKFVDIVTEAISSNTPPKKQVKESQYRNPVQWWDLECEKAKRVRRATYKTWEHTRTLENWIAYKKSSALAKKLFKRKKKNLIENSQNR